MITAQTRQDGQSVTITIAGRLDFKLHKKFREAYKHTSRTTEFVVDMARTECMDKLRAGDAPPGARTPRRRLRQDPHRELQAGNHKRFSRSPTSTNCSYWLPDIPSVTDGQMAEAGPHGSSADFTRIGPLTVLIVDDTRINLLMLEAIL